ncbi:uncharacterized protein METZ01_LOCUS93606 [marine metagenome]|uniref:Uncharacterized protein n=1 Tax=marine metagenome TaxID=408172 RepID=A0A381VKD2_9ZZZZ
MVGLAIPFSNNGQSNTLLGTENNIFKRGSSEQFPATGETTPPRLRWYRGYQTTCYIEQNMEGHPRLKETTSNPI